MSVCNLLWCSCFNLAFSLLCVHPSICLSLVLGRIYATALCYRNLILSLQPMPPSMKTPESDGSDTIYERINEEQPSPGSSSESTTGVDAPLIQPKFTLSNIKVSVGDYEFHLLKKTILFQSFLCSIYVLL